VRSLPATLRGVQAFQALRHSLELPARLAQPDPQVSPVELAMRALPGSLGLPVSLGATSLPQRVQPERLRKLRFTA
jgi:hypothetical protein